MATRIWSSLESTDLNLAANYSGSGDLLTTDDLVFNNTSVINATASANLNVNSITVAANYSGNISFLNRSAIYGGNVIFDGTGTINLGTALTMNGNSATLHIGSGVGVVTASLCTLTMNGTTEMTIDNNKSVMFKSLIIGASAIVTNSGSTTTTYVGTTTLLIFVNGGALTLNQQISLRATANCSVWSITGNPIINGTNTLEVYGRNSGITSTVPAINMSGTTTLNLTGRVTTASTSHTITLSGNISAPTINIMNNTENEFTFNQGEYSITTSGILSIGNSSTGSTTLNFNGSIIVGSVNGSTYNGATSINLGASTISCDGDFTFGSSHTITSGTSVVNITNTSTITSNSKLFYNLIINANTKTITLADALNVHDFTITAGTIAGNFSTTCSGDALFSVNTTLYRLIMTKATSRTITVAAGAILTLSNLTASNFNGSDGALTQWRSGTSGVQFNLVIPDDIELTYQNPQDCNSDHVITVNDGTSVNSGNNTNWTFPIVTDDKSLTVDTFTKIENISQYIDIGQNVIFKDYENNNVNINMVQLNTAGYINIYSAGYQPNESKRIYLISGKWHEISIGGFLSSGTDTGIGIHVK